MNLTLHVWRQPSSASDGKFVTYQAENISPDASFLEMLDVVNETLIERGEQAIHFEHDCRLIVERSALEAVCPKEISVDFIARMNRDYLKSRTKGVPKTPMST